MIPGNIPTDKKIAEELAAYRKELKRSEEYIRWLEQLMFNISHKIRQPIVNIIGLSNLLNINSRSPTQLAKILGFMKKSALSLDNRTRALSTFVNKKLIQLKNKCLSGT
jgi:signal transduction histidine kinase